MRAWRLHEFGSLDHLRLDEVALPRPEPGEVLLRVEYAALNPADRYMALGQYPRPAQPPFALGRDACGTVVQPVAGGRFDEGDRVVLLPSDLGVGRTGTLAEYVSVPERHLAPLPPGWTPVQGAAAPLTFLTAWMALVEEGALHPGHTVLIDGASGGVGVAAIMLASALGARVIALSRGTAKQAVLQSLGASWVVDASAADWDATVKSALGGGRIDLLIDNLGGVYLEKGIGIVGYRGRIIVIGLLAGLRPQLHLGLLIHKEIRVQGASVSRYVSAGADAAWAGVLEALARAERKPVIDQVFPLEQVHAGFERLHAGPVGKVVIAIGNSVD